MARKDFFPFFVDEPEFLFPFRESDTCRIELFDVVVQEGNNGLIGKGDIAVFIQFFRFDNRVFSWKFDFIIQAGNNFFAGSRDNSLAAVEIDFCHVVLERFRGIVFQRDNDIAGHIDVPVFAAHFDSRQTFLEVKSVVIFVGNDFFPLLVDESPFAVGKLVGVSREVVIILA